MMYASMPFLRKRSEVDGQKVWDIGRFVSISFFGNLIACVGFAAIVSTAYGAGERSVLCELLLCSVYYVYFIVWIPKLRF
jgi:hypothetical protein